MAISEAWSLPKNGITTLKQDHSSHSQESQILRAQTIFPDNRNSGVHVLDDSILQISDTSNTPILEVDLQDNQVYFNDSISLETQLLWGTVLPKNALDVIATIPEYSPERLDPMRQGNYAELAREIDQVMSNSYGSGEGVFTEKDRYELYKKVGRTFNPGGDLGHGYKDEMLRSLYPEGAIYSAYVPSQKRLNLLRIGAATGAVLLGKAASDVKKVFPVSVEESSGGESSGRRKHNSYARRADKPQTEVEPSINKYEKQIKELALNEARLREMTGSSRWELFDPHYLPLLRSLREKIQDPIDDINRVNVGAKVETKDIKADIRKKVRIDKSLSDALNLNEDKFTSELLMDRVTDSLAAISTISPLWKYLVRRNGKVVLTYRKDSTEGTYSGGKDGCEHGTETQKLNCRNGIPKVKTITHEFFHELLMSPDISMLCADTGNGSILEAMNMDKLVDFMVLFSRYQLSILDEYIDNSVGTLSQKTKSSSAIMFNNEWIANAIPNVKDYWKDCYNLIKQNLNVFPADSYVRRDFADLTSDYSKPQPHSFDLMVSALLYISKFNYANKRGEDPALSSLLVVPNRHLAHIATSAGLDNKYMGSNFVSRFGRNIKSAELLKATNDLVSHITPFSSIKNFAAVVDSFDDKNSEVFKNDLIDRSKILKYLAMIGVDFKVARNFRLRADIPEFSKVMFSVGEGGVNINSYEVNPHDPDDINMTGSIVRDVDTIYSIDPGKIQFMDYGDSKIFYIDGVPLNPLKFDTSKPVNVYRLSSSKSGNSGIDNSMYIVKGFDNGEAVANLAIPYSRAAMSSQ